MNLFELEPIPEVRNFPPGEHAPRAHARTRDPETSKEAAVAATRNLTEKQRKVMVLVLSYGPISDEELVKYANTFGNWAGMQSPSGIRTRRSELVALGLVVHDGFGTTASGNRCRLWRAT